MSSALNLTSTSYYAYAGGYMFLRYLAKQASEHYPISSGYATDSAASKSVSGTDSGEFSSVLISGALLKILKDFGEDALNLSTYASTVKNVDATELTRGIMIVGNKNANSISATRTTINFTARTATILFRAAPATIRSPAAKVPILSFTTMAKAKTL